VVGAGPPTDPNAPMWGAPVAPAAPAAGAHHVRNGVLAGVAAFALLAGGVAIGHAAWTGGTSTLSSAPSSGSTRLPSGSGNGTGNPFGNGSPFGGALGNSGNTGSGNSGNGNSGSSGGSGPSDASAIAAKVDPGLVDINTTLGYSQEQAAGTGIVLTSNGVILTNNHVINGATKISVTDVGNQKTYTAKGVVWLSVISSAEGKEGFSSPAQAEADRLAYDVHATAVLLDPKGALGKTYGAQTTPHMFVIDKSGRLAYQGAIDDKPSADKASLKGAKNYVADALDAELAGRAPATAQTKSYGCSVKY